MFDFDSGSFELVDSRPASTNNDFTADISVAGDVSRFVDENTGLLLMPVEAYTDGIGFQLEKTLSTDEMTLRVNQ